MADTTKTAAARTAVMNRLKNLMANWISLDTAKNAQQAQWFIPQQTNGITNIQPWDATFWKNEQSLQWSQYAMYPTGSYDNPFARNWDALQTNTPVVNDASNQIIWQFAQYERALNPAISQYQDTAASNQKWYEAQAWKDLNQFKQGNQNLQTDSDQFYKWQTDYLQSEQWAQQAFAANEARRATGSTQSAQAAGQRVWAQYVDLTNQARAQKYAEDKALFNDLTNKISEYTTNIKWSKDQYELDVAKQLLDLRNQLASSLTQQQNALVQSNLQYNMNDLAAQSALVRQMALNENTAKVNKQYK